MTRVLIVVVLAALVAACTSSTSSDPGAGDQTTETFKTEMDAEARDLLPDLMSSLGGELNGMQATFYERSGFGIWDYTASGTVFQLPSTADQALTAGAATLEDHGFTIERNAERKSIRATKQDIRVTLESAHPDDDKGVASLNLTMASADAISDGDDFAENAPSEDYLAYLK